MIKKPNVWITRSKEDNEELENKLVNQGFKCFNCPLIKYRNLESDLSVVLNYPNIIITSKYAAKIINKFILNRNNSYNVWVVGIQSAEILSRFNIKYIASDVDDLIQSLPKNSYHEYIYLSSNEITKDLPIQIKRQVIYEVNYLTDLSLEEIKFMQSNNFDYILLYSKNCAKTLITLLFKYDLIKYLKNPVIVAVSFNVAEEITDYFKNIVYCKKGEYNKILELLVDYEKARAETKY